MQQGVVAICDYTAADGGGMPIPVIVPIIAVGCAFTAPVLGMAAAGADRRRSFLHLHSSRPQPGTQPTHTAASPLVCRSAHSSLWGNPRRRQSGQARSAES
jgi:hypothetical protein